MMDLRRDADVLGTDGKWRLRAADRGADRMAIRFDAERKAADGLAAAGIDPAGGGFARHPARHGAVGNAGGVVPQPAPDRRQHDDDADRQDDRPEPAARPGGGARRPARTLALHHVERRFAWHGSYSSVAYGDFKTIKSNMLNVCAIVPPASSC